MLLSMNWEVMEWELHPDALLAEGPVLPEGSLAGLVSSTSF